LQSGGPYYMGPQHFVIQDRDASSHESLSISLSNWPNSPTPLPSFSPTRCAWWKNGRRVTVIRVQRVRETEYYLMTSSGVLLFPGRLSGGRAVESIRRGFLRLTRHVTPNETSVEGVECGKDGCNVNAEAPYENSRSASRRRGRWVCEGVECGKDGCNVNAEAPYENS
jgi:hypothetical protein